MDVFGQPLTRFGLCCAGALLAGLVTCGIRMKQCSKSYGDWIRFVLCVTGFSWLFARLMFSFAEWIMILLEGIFDLETGRDPLSVIYFWHGGYSLMGAVLGAVIGAITAEKWTGSGRGRSGEPWRIPWLSDCRSQFCWNDWPRSAPDLARAGM